MPVRARLGPFEIIGPLGVGGMGEVYEARDTRLGRRVAIKVLPPGLASDPGRRRRFEREARAASALNHPHICTVYDFASQPAEGGWPAIDYLVMEYLEGRTLADHLQEGPLPLPQALTVADQIADALAAAHREGIIHRDLKPGNVMLTQAVTSRRQPGADDILGGRRRPENPLLTHGETVKILDFGLAKQVAALMDPAGTAKTTSCETRPGAVVGTLGYQSPEQARGEEVDLRTDVFSFGAVFYEILTGRSAFRGSSEADTIAAVLHLQPPPPSTRNKAVPASCDAIVAKAVEKDRDLRYQSADEIRVDLLRVRRELSAESVAPAGAADRAAKPARPPRRLLAWASVGAAILLAAAAWALGLMPRIGSRNTAIPPIITREVSWGSGSDTEPALAPDGHTVAYVAEEDGDTEIFLTDLNGVSVRRWTTNPGVDRHPAWSADGGRIYFESERHGRRGIYEAPALSGEPAVLLFPDGHEPAVSPDGRSLAFALSQPGQADRIAVGSLASPALAPRVISQTGVGLSDHGSPAWSPDGREICYWAWDGLWVIPAAGGPARQLTHGPADLHPAWSASGFIYFSSTRGGLWQLWRVSADGTNLSRVTAGLGTEQCPTLAGDGRTLAFSSAIEGWHVVVRDLASGVEHQLAGGDLQSYPKFSRDGRTLFLNMRAAGRQGAWMQRLVEGRPDGAPTPLQAMFADPQPTVVSQATPSPDGQWVAFLAITGESRDIWIAPSAGGMAVNATNHPARDDEPAWSPDGTKLLFSSDRDGATRLWVQAVRDGHPIGVAARLTSGVAEEWFGVFSADGRRVALLVTAPDGSRDAAVVPASGRSVPASITSGIDAWFAEWLPSGLVVVNGRWQAGEARRSLRAIDPGSRSVVASFTPVELAADRRARHFDVTTDGRYLAVVRGRSSGRIGILEAKTGRF